jgi:hypothetical protein
MGQRREENIVKNTIHYNQPHLMTVEEKCPSSHGTAATATTINYEDVGRQPPP